MSTLDQFVAQSEVARVQKRQRDSEATAIQVRHSTPY